MGLSRKGAMKRSLEKPTTKDCNARTNTAEVQYSTHFTTLILYLSPSIFLPHFRCPVDDGLVRVIWEERGLTTNWLGGPNNCKSLFLNLSKNCCKKQSVSR